MVHSPQRPRLSLRLALGLAAALAAIVSAAPITSSSSAASSLTNSNHHFRRGAEEPVHAGQAIPESWKRKPIISLAGQQGKVTEDDHTIMAGPPPAPPTKTQQDVPATPKKKEQKAQSLVQILNPAPNDIWISGTLQTMTWIDQDLPHGATLDFTLIPADPEAGINPEGLEMTRRPMARYIKAIDRWFDFVVPYDLLTRRQLEEEQEQEAKEGGAVVEVEGDPLNGTAGKETPTTAAAAGKGHTSKTLVRLYVTVYEGRTNKVLAQTSVFPIEIRKDEERDRRMSLTTIMEEIQTSRAKDLLRISTEEEAAVPLPDVLVEKDSELAHMKQSGDHAHGEHDSGAAAGVEGDVQEGTEEGAPLEEGSVQEGHEGSAFDGEGELLEEGEDEGAEHEDDAAEGESDAAGEGEEGGEHDHDHGDGSDDMGDGDADMEGEEGEEEDESVHEDHSHGEGGEGDETSGAQEQEDAHEHGGHSHAIDLNHFENDQDVALWKEHEDDPGYTIPIDVTDAGTLNITRWIDNKDRFFVGSPYVMAWDYSTPAMVQETQGLTGVVNVYVEDAETAKRVDIVAGEMFSGVQFMYLYPTKIMVSTNPHRRMWLRARVEVDLFLEGRIRRYTGFSKAFFVERGAL